MGRVGMPGRRNAQPQPPQPETQPLRQWLLFPKPQLVPDANDRIVQQPAGPPGGSARRRLATNRIKSGQTIRIRSKNRLRLHAESANNAEWPGIGLCQSISHYQRTQTARTFTNDVLTQESNLINTENNHWRHLLLNVNLRHVFKNKQEWSADIDRLYYHNDDPNAYTSTMQDFTTGSQVNEQIRISKKTPVQTWVLKTDFIKPTAKGRFETGLKATTTRLDNDVALDRLSAEGWKADSFYTQRYQLAEDILAGYISSTSPSMPKRHSRPGCATNTPTPTSTGPVARLPVASRSSTGTMATCFRACFCRGNWRKIIPPTCRTADASPGHLTVTLRPL